MVVSGDIDDNVSTVGGCKDDKDCSCVVLLLMLALLALLVLLPLDEVLWETAVARERGTCKLSCNADK